MTKKRNLLRGKAGIKYLDTALYYRAAIVLFDVIGVYVVTVFYLNMTYWKDKQVVEQFQQQNINKTINF